MKAFLELKQELQLTKIQTRASSFQIVFWTVLVSDFVCTVFARKSQIFCRPHTRLAPKYLLIHYIRTKISQVTSLLTLKNFEYSAVSITELTRFKIVLSTFRLK